MAAGSLAAGCSSDAQAVTCGVPAGFAWTSPGAVLAPVSDATHNLVVDQRPVGRLLRRQWHVFVSTVDANGGYSMAYISFADWDAHGRRDASTTWTRRRRCVGFTRRRRSSSSRRRTSGTSSSSQGSRSSRRTTTSRTRRAGPAGDELLRHRTGHRHADRGRNGGWLDFWVICDAQPTATCSSPTTTATGIAAQTTVAEFPQRLRQSGGRAPRRRRPDAPVRGEQRLQADGDRQVPRHHRGFDASSSDKRYFRSWTADALEAVDAAAGHVATPFARRPT